MLAPISQAILHGRIVPTLLAALVWISCAFPAKAVVVLTSGILSTGKDTISYNQWQASSFRLTEIAGDWEVLMVALQLEVVVPNQHVFVGITSSLSGSGGPDLNNVLVQFEEGNLRSDAIPVQTTVFLSVDSASSRPLAADATYWLVFGVSLPDTDLDPPSSGLYHWHYGSPPTSSEPGWEVGSSIASAGTAGQNWTVESANTYNFSIGATPFIAIPETKETTLILLSFCTILRRRFRP